MPASPSDAVSSQFDATQFHPEFGYLAPTMHVRRKVALTLKAAACGVLIGAAAMFVAVMDREGEEETALTMLATPVLVIPTSPTPTPAPINNLAPVLFVPESIALPAATPKNPGFRSVTSPAVAAAAAGPPPLASANATPLAAPAVTTASAPASAPEVKATAKPKKKVVREPQPDRTVRPAPAEPEPRAAFAGSSRRFAEPPVPGHGRPIFGFGW